MYETPDTEFLKQHSMDAYLLLRYLKVVIVILLVGAGLTWPVLIPMHVAGRGGRSQLDMLGISNIAAADYSLYYAHCFISWAFVGFIFAIITRENLFLIHLRQGMFRSPTYADHISSRTVLFLSVPKTYTDHPTRINEMFDMTTVRRVWFGTDTTALESKVKERLRIVEKLEAAEAQSRTQGQLPMHRPRPIVGRKVESMEWAWSELRRLQPEIRKLQCTHRRERAKRLPSMFVEFSRLSDALNAYQTIRYPLPLQMWPRYIGLQPNQVVWKNLGIRWWARPLRSLAAVGISIAMITFWAVPTTIVSLVSNLAFLERAIPFLTFLDRVPGWLRGSVIGLLPSIALAALLAVVPVIFRLMARWSGAPTLASVELRTQNWYFAFQTTQVFLVFILATSASSVVASILREPQGVVKLLAQNIVRTSNFYISYIILQGLAFSPGALLQITKLAKNKIWDRFVSKRPRQLYHRLSQIDGLQWGTIYPCISLLVVIGIAYSCVAPLVLGFGAIGMSLFYSAYRYNALCVLHTTVDTKGLGFACALQHITTGCYLLILCLIGVFAMGATANPVALGPTILMLVFLVVVAVYHISLNTAIRPLLAGLAPAGATRPVIPYSFNPAGRCQPAQMCPSSGEELMCGGSNMNLVEKDLPRPPKSGPQMLSNWFSRLSYFSLSEIYTRVPSLNYGPPHLSEIEADTYYYHPCVTSEMPDLLLLDETCGQETISIQRIILTPGLEHERTFGSRITIMKNNL
ncbi:hypothetical protein NUU61_001566 [Penicillium alfredii]|uniref:DUF221-domain-containing protein n=1 Tax=Penicillium alfredii TaxID=1506179 RepID=A0A9W9KN75_9EURO|nr:uncharacterized protein NUU61_001307 [Penicillium alfredii]XP_056515415.1 uncharacterized protein NUU61_001566 [Penicillium alfredii]KAJ5111677.1 hypothetical protein NUU61_001307 [Penicillium alfredii]KAJ5111936.1 hypothetical protein NUU61_001566 [Penicillium alfredii]